jgi:hypothetical protein
LKINHLATLGWRAHARFLSPLRIHKDS